VVKLEKIDGFSFFSFFYLITGIVLSIIMVQSESVPIHVGFLGALSLIASYGLNRMKKWALFLTVFISLSGITFGCVTVYAVYQMFNLGLMETVFIAMVVLYVALLAASSFYVARKKDKFR